MGTSIYGIVDVMNHDLGVAVLGYFCEPVCHKSNTLARNLAQ